MSPPVAMCLITKTRLDSETETLIPVAGGGFDVPHTFKLRGGCEGGGKGYLGQDEQAFTLATTQDQWLAQPVAFTRCDNGQDAQVDVTPTMRCGSNYSAHLAVAQPVAIQGTVIGRSETAGPQGSGADASGAMFTLTKTDIHAVAFGGDIARSLTARHDSSPCADRGMDVVAVDFRHTDLTGETVHTLQAKKTGGYSLNYQPGVMQTMQVRRLTPVECERLQGFPDGYTAIPWRNKPAAECPDGPRYKALGNSMAVPVMSWIGERINEVNKL